MINGVDTHISVFLVSVQLSAECMGGDRSLWFPGCDIILVWIRHPNDAYGKDIFKLHSTLTRESEMIQKYLFRYFLTVAIQPQGGRAINDVGPWILSPLIIVHSQWWQTLHFLLRHRQRICHIWHLTSLSSSIGTVGTHSPMQANRVISGVRNLSDYLKNSTSGYSKVNLAIWQNS